MTNDESLGVLLERIRHDCREAHERALSLVSELSEEQIRHQAGPYSPSIGFHLWHLARWAEHDIEQIDGKPQRWHAEAMAGAWGFPPETGEDQTGTELADDAASLLVLPSKAVLLDYATFALNGIDAVVERKTRELADGSGEAGVVANLFAFFTHDNRHLGMMEALRGLMGEPGTATR